MKNIVGQFLAGCGFVLFISIWISAFLWALGMAPEKLLGEVLFPMSVNAPFLGMLWGWFEWKKQQALKRIEERYK